MPTTSGLAAEQVAQSTLGAAPQAAATRPSEGWINSQPEPENDTWTVSPEPRPMNVFRLTSVLIELVSPLDQVIAACGSA